MISKHASIAFRNSKPQAIVKGGNHSKLSVVRRGLKENVAALPPIDHVDAVEVAGAATAALGSSGGAAWVIRNAPGTAASARIFAHLAAAGGGAIDAAAAAEGLRLYDEYVAEARALPGSHPNIDLLLSIAEAGAPAVKVTLKEKAAGPP